MAEKRFLKGLFKDTGHIDQPNGTWRHARNMLLNDTEGAVSNEGGTEFKSNLGTSYATGAINDKVIGAIEVTEDRAILFVVDVVTVYAPPGTAPRSEIGIFENDTYTPIFNPNLLGGSGQLTNDLNFRESHPINGTFKIDPKGDLIVYFTDDLNPPRAFNVDRQRRESTSVTRLYGITSSNLDNIDILNLFPYSGPVPHIDIDDQGTHQNCVIEGGGLLTGVYYLALAYVDDDLVATNYLTVSNPIPITDEFDSTIPTNKKDGAAAGSQTTKSIKWEITNLNVDYKYLRPIVIRSKGDAQEAFKLNDQLFNSNSTTVIYSGLETVSTGSPSEVIIDTISYDTAKTIQQLDGVLYLGNTTGSKDVGYQKFANNIKLRSRVDEIKHFDTFYAGVDNLENGWGSRPVNSFGKDASGDPIVQTVDPTKSYRYVPNIFKYKGYMRGEVYAFYIAFVMKDGSMSYAYHIPGREAVDSFRELDSPSVLGSTHGTLWDDIENVSPTYGKMFHWMDTYLNAISIGNYSSTTSQHLYMNFWHNATEFYPNTENYEVWSNGSGGGAQIGDMQGLNVRHHHFPSNRNRKRMSIKSDKLCRTVKTAGSSAGLQPWTGRMAMLHCGAGEQYVWYNCCSNWSRNRFTHSPQYCQTSVCSQWGSASGGYSNDPSMQAALWDGQDTFTADQEMQVRVRFKVVHRQSTSNDPSQDVCTRIRRNISTVTSSWPSMQDCDGHPIKWTSCGHGGNSDCGGGTTGQNWVGYNAKGWSGWATLNAGDTIWMESQKSSSADSSMYQTGRDYYRNSCVGPWGFSYIEFDVKAAAGVIDDHDLHDAKIDHHINRLGFDLRDIKIPQSIADQVQGFRIYYANRKHSDRTVLGQSVLIPALFQKQVLGICSEASNDVDEVSQILGTLQSNPEEFYNMDAYARNYDDYLDYPFEVASGGPTSPVTINQIGAAMNVFSFHDFSLLKSKNSLAPATHIDIIYYVQNLAWNGPGLDQDKKMVTTLSAGTTAGDPLKVKEVWGWDANQNCYPQKMKSAFFAGVHYGAVNERTQPRLIGQKAKTYLLGDTIFKGSSLGFGGKLFNEFGESCIAFKLMDRHAIDAYKVRSYLTTGSVGYFSDTYGPNSTEANDWGNYGQSHGGFATLTNTLDSSGTFTNTASGSSHHQRSQQAMVNLKAFKTDVFKSIDSQELVWTGFEVLGNQLNEYVFDSQGTMQGSGNTIDTHPDGIYGGDTFICRYGISTALKPSNPSQSAEPEKGVHYHIVESTDNINFRHVQDDNSLYFPNTVLKEMLREAGQRDLNHFDNLRYNTNYSENNDIRPAFPLPLRDTIQDDFPTRTHRSAKHDTTSIIDNYRIFLANQFKDLPKNRGDLWKLSSFNNLLYFHMQDSLYAAQGKQTMNMGDGSEAFVGSGDIFAQEPNELVHTQGGFGGTQSHYAAITTRYGYFFVDQASRKVFMMKDALEEISNLGMGDWFQENMDLAIAPYAPSGSCLQDNPIVGVGYHSVYDPKYKRILLTKRDKSPTSSFITGFNKPNVSPFQAGTIRFNSNLCAFVYYNPGPPGGQGYFEPLDFNDSRFFTEAGWTISYYPETGMWGSFHDYIPYIYFNTQVNFYSLTDKYLRPTWVGGTPIATHTGTTFGNTAIWQHNSDSNKGILYQENSAGVYTNAEWLTSVDHYPFELEFIHNEFKAEDTLLASINYTLETINQNGISVLEHGFTKFLVYNTFQMSGENPLEYFINIRRVGNNWKINKFRDMAAIALDSNPYYMSGNTNIIGGSNAGTITSSSTQNMFIYNGMLKSVNPLYLDLAKTWNVQRKFMDKWVGIRLIYDNISNNLLNLYATDVAVRKVYR